MIPVLYSEAMLADSDSPSPSAGKPKAVLEAWREAPLPIEVHEVVPVTVEELSAAHDPTYVADVLACREDNGFGNRSPEVARSLPFTSGAMLCAARQAIAHRIACAPVSGFHHANYAFGHGFCTFNGLMVTAIRLLDEGLVRRIMILDADMHEGDGTDDIIERLALFGVDNVTLGALFKTSAQADEYLQFVRSECARFPDYDLVLYQAGADVHVEDPLGGVLTTEQMRLRDEMVFQTAHTAGVPLAWNLAGGYQKPLSLVVELHTQTMRECVRAYGG
jgi:acetoin utilization deacetylase AcuC-like enzyme